MTRAKSRPKKRQRGEIETLASGALRVKVYAGVDPLSGRRHYLRETIPPGPKAEAAAEAARVRLEGLGGVCREDRVKSVVVGSDLVIRRRGRLGG